jgi:hypothetical protein
VLDYGLFFDASPVSAATASADLEAGDILNSITACTLRRVPSDLYLNSSLVIADQ